MEYLPLKTANLLLLLSIATPVFGADKEGVAAWRNMEFPAKVMSSVALDDDTSLLATDKGLYQFSIKEEKWQFLEAAGKKEFSNLFVATSGTLLACSNEGLFFSTDRGKTWSTTLEENYDPIAVSFVAMDPSGATIAAALIDEGGDGSPEKTELYFSPDVSKKDSWKLLNVLHMPIRDLGIQKGGKEVLFVSPMFGPLLSTNGGASFLQVKWQPAENKTSREIAMQNATAMGRFVQGTFAISSTKGRLWALQRDLTNMDWQGADRHSTPIPSSRGTRTLIPNQHGEFFLFERIGATAVGGGMGMMGMVAMAQQQNGPFLLMDPNQKKTKIWACEPDNGCSVEAKEAYAIVSNKDRTVHWVSLDTGFYRVSQKKPFAMELNIVGEGEVTVFNATTGLVQPHRASVELKEANFGGEFDKITVSAEPKNKEWVFKGWAGLPCQNLLQRECTFELKSDLKVIARFEKVK